MDITFSFIIPVYNRPEEMAELLESLSKQTYAKPFGIVVVEDGSTINAKKEVSQFADRLNIHYVQKPNTGPGDSRNFGMRIAKGNYFILLDSDCIAPPKYLENVDTFLANHFVHCFGGPDGAHPTFSNLQKSINYAMTSFITTGGMRGKKTSIHKFQPRSFNMGISKKAFEATKGFGNIHPGEDPDLSIRLWRMGFDTLFIPGALVYHKRRIDWGRFFHQVKKFGMVRPILNLWHPGSAKISYWFPTVFSIFLIFSFVALLFGFVWPTLLLFGYFTLVFLHALMLNKSIMVAFLSVIAVMVQFCGYGYGFLRSFILINCSKKSPEELFPNLFFKPNAYQ